MKIGIFYEHCLPKPWGPDDERKLFQNVLEQVELADKLGFQYVWNVEHHFLEEYAHSSAPEVLLAAYSQRTKNIRLGHGIVQTPPQYNHPARVAERIATLDLVSNGRVEFGTGESSSEAELGGFCVPRDEKRDAWLEGTECTIRLMTETPFTGFEGRYVKMPPRNLVPKPVQKPHPPLWLACSQRDTIKLAARKGMGVMTQAFLGPQEAAQWVGDYHAIVESECVPIGEAVNPQIAIGSTLSCFNSEEEAYDKLVDGANFFTYALSWHYVHGRQYPGKTSIWELFENDTPARREAQRLYREGLANNPNAVRGVVGTPAQCRQELLRYEASGVDQVFLFSQGGRNRHEDICESYERFATTVLPEFLDRDATGEEKRRLRAEELTERALLRKERNAPDFDPSYTIDAPLADQAGAASGPQIF